MEDVEADQTIVIKTHGRLRKGAKDFINHGIQLGTIKVHPCCRDPRDIVLSIMDHGRKSSQKEVKVFSNI